MSHEPPNGTRERIGRLYDAHGNALFRYALMLLADPAAAEDAIQQVFLSLLRGGAEIDRGPELHYLRRAVRNECYSMLRRLRHRRGGSGVSLTSDGVARAEHALLHSRDPRATTDERLALEEAIRSLPPEQREVLHLHLFEGMTFEEAAAATGESVNTIASRYRYGLDRLRKTLAPYSGSMRSTDDGRSRP